MQEYENIGLGLGAAVVANLVTKLPVIQASNNHIVMDNYFTTPALWGTPNRKCCIARYGKDEQTEARIIRCGYCVLEHHCSTLER